MIPITRKEHYLNRIVGNNDYEIPEKPITTEEFFFAEILGEAVQAPEPLTRYQIYLAKIAGKDVEIPYPETRLEYFLARAAGMNVETPTPITREEIFWSNYSAIVDFEVEGVPPLTYKAIEGTLENYRIYGNTVNGENVGDLITEGEHAGEYKVPVTVEGKNLLQNTATSQTTNGVTFTVNEDGSVTCNGTASNAAWFTVNRSFDLYAPEGRIVSIGNNGSTSTFYLNISYVGNVTTSLNYSRTTHQNAYVQLVIAAGYTCDNLTFYPMIRKADITDDTYEPYYAPITTPIYLPEPLKMVGDEAEYIDYAEQKQHVATTYMVSITPKTDVSKIVFVTMSSVPDDCTILTSGLIFTLDEADANTLNSTNYADGVKGKASTAHNYKYTWTKKYTEGETYYIRSYVKYQTADNEIKEVYGDVYKADINGFERVRKNLLPNTATSQTINTERDVTLPTLPTLSGTNTLSVGTEVQPSKVYIKGEKERE